MKKFLNTLTIFATIVVILFSKIIAFAQNGDPVFKKGKQATPEMVARYIETNEDPSGIFIPDNDALAHELAKSFNYQNAKFNFVSGETFTEDDVPDLLRSSKMYLVKAVWSHGSVKSTGYFPTDKHFRAFNRPPFPDELVWMFKVNDEVEFYWYSDKCGNPLYDDYHQPKKVVYEPRIDPNPEPNPPTPKEEDIIYRYPPPPAKDNIIVINEGDNITIVESSEQPQQQNYCGTSSGISFQASAGLYLGTGGGYSGGGNCYQPRNYCSSGSGRGGSYGGGSSSNPVVNNYVDVYVNNNNQNSNTNTNHQTNHQTQTNHQFTATTVSGGSPVVHQPTTPTPGGGPVYPPNGPSNPNGGTGGGPIYGSNRQARTKIVQAERFQQGRPSQNFTQTQTRSAQRQVNYGQQQAPPPRVASSRPVPQQRFAQARPMQRQDATRSNNGGGGGNHRASRRN